MNRREAIEKTIVIWQWMLDNSNHSKGAALNACFPGEVPLFQCYLCEFARTTNKYVRETCDCTICPVWPVASPDEDGCGNESTYSAWALANIAPFDAKQADYAARRIISDCQLALSNLKES